MLALLCLGCAARRTAEHGKRLSAGLGSVAGALAAVGNPCAGMAVPVQGALEATGVIEALGSLGGGEPDPKFVAFMEKLRREADERRAARRLEEEAREAANVSPGKSGAPMGGAPQTGGMGGTNENAPLGLDHGTATDDSAGQTMVANTRYRLGERICGVA